MGLERALVLKTHVAIDAKHAALRVAANGKPKRSPVSREFAQQALHREFYLSVVGILPSLNQALSLFFFSPARNLKALGENP